GASPRRLVRSVVMRSARIAALGGAAGLAIALGGARVMQSMLFATDPRDAGTLTVVSLLLMALAIIACAMPAIRAARVDPMTTLRAE
ncbi:MAG TPA: FtsX-like permease family protein, partial [Vicinamibacterales bacterium]